jgi:hypothetical protein
LLQPRVEAGKGASHHTDDDGGVVENVRDEDGGERPCELEIGRRKNVVDKSSRTEQGIESRRDDHGGKHERDGGQRTQQGFAAEIISRKEVSGGQSEQEREKGGENSLVEGEA